MTDPSQARIAAALRLAEAAVAYHMGKPGPCGLGDALAAYRATLPRIRSRAEVDGEIVQAVREQWLAGKGGGMIWDGLLRTTLEHLCREPTDSGPSSVDTPDPPPVPVSPAGAAYSRETHQALEQLAEQVDFIQAHLVLDLKRVHVPDNPSGPPGVAAAKESTDNAAALEGAANCEAERCSCEESLVLRAEIVDLRRCLTWLNTRGGLELETHSRIRRVLGPIRETDL